MNDLFGNSHDEPQPGILTKYDPVYSDIPIYCWQCGQCADYKCELEPKLKITARRKACKYFKRK